MNHFMYPEAGKKDKRTVVYGDVAMPVLIRLMKDFGAEREKLVAQLYGGGCQFGDEKRSVGPRNVEVARSVLEEFRIPLITEDIGGRMGRKILFDTATGEAAVLKVHALRREDWYHPGKKQYGEPH
jgi:chemotaxis protein CheD